MAKDLICSIDQGTTGSTALLLDVSSKSNPKVIAKATVEFPQHFPAPGWVEHDLNEIWASIREAIIKASAQIGGPEALQRIAGLGISNQRETLCVFNRHDSTPVCNAIVWQCRRTTQLCKDLRDQGLEPSIRQKTGLLLDPYFSASKAAWLMENNDIVRSSINSGKAVFGTIDTWLIHKLTGGQSHVTESSNASRTMLFNINQNAWDQDLLKMFGINSPSSLPEVRPSAGLFGVTKGLGVLPDGIPISGVLGDQQAALAGQACFERGEAKCTYGTGAFLLLNSGNQPPRPGNGLLTTIAWNLDGNLTYALEGSSFIAGAAIQFIRDQFQFLAKSADSEELAKKGSAAPHLYFVPALAGLGAPWWNPSARGAILGMHRGTTKNDIIRAALEGIALQVTDLATAMKQLLGADLRVLRVDGGAAANGFLMQLQADLLAVSVDRPKDIESTAIGAGLFAGLGVGIYKTLQELAAARTSDCVFKPTTNPGDINAINQMKSGWVKAIKAVQVFSDA